MSYQVTHLKSGESFSRPRVYFNKHNPERDWTHHVERTVEEFHKTLPYYGETALHSLPSIASELGFKHVFVKDESTRFGLPSFKILGASWAIHRAICKRLDLDPSTSMADLKQALKGRSDVRLVTCTEGNWGRASARMGHYLGIPVRIHVPWFMSEYTQDLLRGEGAEVKLLSGGSYDDTIAAVQHDAEAGGWVMVLDTSWEGYEEVPQWVADGYNTMLTETDRQVSALTDGNSPDLAVVSVGVGSWAHAVVSHYKSKSSEKRIIAVEPIVSASLKESLHCDRIVPIKTGETIMNGMNCGTTSTIAWPVLRDGIYASVTVDDVESHERVEFLQAHGVNVGPCGAATLAALEKFCAETSNADRSDQTVVLFSTEGMREYEVPVPS